MSSDDPLGKASLYSAAVPRAGTVLVHCSRCDASSRVGLAELAKAHLPVWAWVPLRQRGHFLRCPSCGTRTWVSIAWRG